MYKGLIIVCLLLNMNLFSQSNYQTRSVVPPSPNAASLGKYGEVPVSAYTGVSNISIPIHTINAGRITVPISLSYHSGGIKVEETASWVGLGWSLNAGGRITRTIRGRPDDDPIQGLGYMNYPSNSMTVHQVFSAMPTTQDSIQWYMQKRIKYVTRAEDAEPDLYYLDIPGNSLKFYFNQESQQFYTIPASKFKINKETNGWTVKDQNGLVYTFSVAEMCNSPWDSKLGVTGYETSWLLTSIYDPLTDQTVTFNYTLINLDFYNGVSDVDYWGLTSGAGREGNLSYQASYVSQARLNAISFNTGAVIFQVGNSARMDLPDDRALETILIHNLVGDTVKKFTLKTSYFQGSPASFLPPNGPSVPSEYSYRLKLDSVLLVDNGNILTCPRYKFEYNTTMMANRLSLDQDEWGYYNNRNNTRLVKDEFNNVGSIVVHMTGGDRRVDTIANQMGILKKIIYPTGGYSEFEYETNRYTISNPGGYVRNDQILYVYPCENGNCPDANVNPPYIYKEVPFSVYNPGGFTEEVWGEMTQLDDDYLNGCPNHLANCYVQGTDSANQNVHEILNGTSYPFRLYNGNYKLVAEFSSECYWDYFQNAQAILHLNNVYVYTGASLLTKYVGGLRIRSIKTTDPVSGMSSLKTYEYLKPNSVESSGIPPEGMEYNYVVVRGTSNTTAPGSNNPDYLYLKRQSTSWIPLCTTKGSSIGYSSVKEKLWGDGELIGLTEFFFVSSLGYPDYNFTDHENSAPFLPVTNRDYMRGELQSKYEYSIVGNNTQLVHSIENEYADIKDSTQSSWSYGYCGGAMIDYSGGVAVGEYSSEDYSGFLIPPIFGAYKEFADRLLLKKTIETTYDQQDPSKYVQTITEFEHSPFNYEVSSIENYVLNSGTKDIKKIKYPGNYFSSTSLAVDNDIMALKGLNDLNNVNEPVEIALLKDKGNGPKLVGGSLTLFNENFLPKRMEGMEMSELLNDDAISSNQLGYLSKHNNLKSKVEFKKYDSQGNLLSQGIANNVVESYTYGFSNYPFSKTINAEFNEVYFDGFEEATGWQSGALILDNTVLRSGRQSGKLEKQSIGELNCSSTNTLSLTLTSAKEFQYSGWVKSNGPAAKIYLIMKRAGETNDYTYIDQVQTSLTNQWAYIQKVISVPADVTEIYVRVSNSGGGIVWFDDIRFHPASAVMSTYTYVPLLGLTSETDGNNRTTYYEYDEYGRLKLIRDHNGNIRKVNQYKYLD